MNQPVSSFLQYFTVEKGFSNNTLNAYRNDLGQFCAFLQGQTCGVSHGNCKGDGSNFESSKASFTWSKIDINVLDNYVQDLKVRRRYQDATTARKVASLKTFFHFLAENSVITDDPSPLLSSPRVGRIPPKFLSEEEVTSLLDAAYKSGTSEGQRDAVIMELL